MRKAGLLFIAAIMYFTVGAQTQHSREHYTAEVAYYTKKLAEEPNNITYYYARASFNQIICVFQGARNDYKKVLELYTENPKKYARVATDACYFLADDYYFRNSDRANAQVYIAKGLEISPDDKRFEVLKTGILGTYPEKEAEAEKEFGALIKKYPKDEKIALYYAKFLEHKDIERSIELYEKVVSLNAFNFDALFALGAYYTNEASRIYKENGDAGKVLTYTNKSLSYFERLYQLNPDDKEIIQILMQLYGNLERPEDVQRMEEKL